MVLLPPLPLLLAGLVQRANVEAMIKTSYQSYHVRDRRLRLQKVRKFVHEKNNGN
jgi:hypothetical protein